MSMPPQETLVRGKYRITERIGEGGMGVVDAGINVLTERDVAIKRMHRFYVDDPSMSNRFEREARAAGRIKSRHVVEVLDIDRDEDNVPFIVMERLNGESLQTRLERTKTVPAAELVEITRQILIGIAAAHNAGVIHRDLKPGNVFLTRPHIEDPLDAAAQPGQVAVKVLDFGISKIRGEEQRDVTKKGETLGTFSYMAPEQIRRGATAGPQADLWSIGIVVYMALTGENPFEAEDQLSLLARILEHPPAALVSFPHIDLRAAEAFQPLVDRALEKDLGRRYANAEEMLVEVDRVEAALHMNGPPRTRKMTRPTPPPRPRLPMRRSGLLLASAVVITLVIGATAGTALGLATAPEARAGTVPETIAIDTEPPWADVLVKDAIVADRTHVAMTPNAKVTARVEAPGYEPRVVELPSRPGSRALVRLALSPLAPTNKEAVVLSTPTIELESPAVPSGNKRRGTGTRGGNAGTTTKATSAPRAITRPPY
ncbi:MAG: serine/threonine protein kinase [Myxococcaceae bacterium]|nr:serine/threonine protein kinase [Myxococcaceae bacterium]